MKFRADDPYIQPERLPRNIRYARTLLGIYSGRESELTAIHQYIYHHAVIHPELPELSECLRQIAMVEMHHLNLLAGTIHMLGLRPSYAFYQGTRRMRWNAGFVQYGRNGRDMLDIDICGEMRAVEGYQNAIRCIPDDQIQRMLRRIIKDEELHIEILTGLRERL